MMVKNEGRFLEKVLKSALLLSGTVVVGDTGSTDNTAEIAKSFDGVKYLPLGNLVPAQLGVARNLLASFAFDYGAKWVMVVDGDEYYFPEQMTYLGEQEMPEGKVLGYTTMVSVDEDEETGEWWLLDDRFNRQAIYPADMKMVGVYPFEAPEAWEYQSPKINHYFDVPEGNIGHAYHLHRLRRSNLDADVYLRLKKQKQFSMQDVEVPRLHRIDAI